MLIERRKTIINVGSLKCEPTNERLCESIKTTSTSYAPHRQTPLQPCVRLSINQWVNQPLSYVICAPNYLFSSFISNKKVKGGTG
jgi:hypothetical protein